MGNYDSGIILLDVDGTTIPGFVGLDDLQVGDDDSYNEGPGGIVLGFNGTKRSNKIQFTIAIRQTSSELVNTVIDAAANSKSVRVHAYIPADDQDIIGDGELTEVLASEARLNHQGGPFKGDEAGDHTFQVLGKDGQLVTKQ